MSLRRRVRQSDCVSLNVQQKCYKSMFFERIPLTKIVLSRRRGQLQYFLANSLLAVCTYRPKFIEFVLQREKHVVEQPLGGTPRHRASQTYPSHAVHHGRMTAARKHLRGASKGSRVKVVSGPLRMQVKHGLLHQTCVLTGPAPSLGGCAVSSSSFRSGVERRSGCRELFVGTCVSSRNVVRFCLWGVRWFN